MASTDFEVLAAAEHGGLLVLVSGDRSTAGCGAAPYIQADLAWALAHRLCQGTLRGCQSELRRIVCETRMSLARCHLQCDYWN